MENIKPVADSPVPSKPLYQLYAEDLDDIEELLADIPGGRAGRVDQMLQRIAEIRAERDAQPSASAYAERFAHAASRIQS